MIEDKESLDYDAFLGTSSYKMEKSEESDKSEEPEERKNAAESDNGSSLNRYNGIKEDMEVLRENSIKLKFSSSDDTETDDTITLYQADSPSVEDGFTGGFESGESSATEDGKKIPKIVSRGFISSDNEKRDRTVSSEKMETDGDGNIFSFLSEEQNKDDFEDTGEHKKTDEDCNIGDEDSFDTASDMDYEDDTE